MKKILALVLVVMAVTSFVAPLSVSAQILPKGLEQVGETGKKLGTNPAETTYSIVQSAMTILFVAVFIVAVFYTFMAAIKYIRSEGNEQKVEEAKNAIKAVLFGVAAMFIAIVGILLINAIFGGNAGGQNVLVDAINGVLNPLRGK